MMVRSVLFTGTAFITGLIIREPISHRLFGRKRLCVGFAEVIATLSPGCSEIFHSLMICIDQSVIAEREKTLGKSIDGMPLCGGEHLLGSFPHRNIAE
jgi:hypothetical protein